MLTDYRITTHAEGEMERRQISREIVENVLAAPGQVVDLEKNRYAYQSKIDFGGKLYVVRVIVEDSEPAVVVTVYRTSKIEKYWSTS